MSFPVSSLQIEFCGQIHNLGELAEQLGAPDLAPETVLRMAWEAWNTDLARRLTGDYAFAIHDPARHLTYLVRDRLGVKPLYYRLDSGRLAWAFSLPELRRRCPLPVTPDTDWVAAYLLSLSYSPSETAYREIRKLPPAHWLRLDGESRVHVERYHQWRDDAPTAVRREPRWVDSYRATLEESVRCRMDTVAPMGVENSGGLDSATITAYLARFLDTPGERLHCFGYALHALEPNYIREVSQAAGIRHNYIVTDRFGPIDEDVRIAEGLAALGYPEEHGNASGHLPFYAECRRRGIRTLFSGFGGDEVVSQSGEHLRHELLDGGRFRALWEILPGNPAMRMLRLLKIFALSFHLPTHNRRFLAAWRQSWPYQPLRPEVVERLGLYEKFIESARYDAPYRRINDFILAYHLDRMQFAARLENCTVMAAAYGVDYRWPLWDARLVQQYLSTPSVEKYGPDGMGRYLHRRAVTGVVPDSVAWKRSKDMGARCNAQVGEHDRVTRLAARGTALMASLHPALEDIVDRSGLMLQIQRVGHGSADETAAFCLLLNLRRLAWLNAWLANG